MCIRDRDNCEYAELREHSHFQTLTRLSNYLQCGTQGFMTKCHLGQKITWPAKERSEAGGKALTFKFLSEYSAAVHVDVIHALSLSAVKKGSQKYRKLLLMSKGTPSAPKANIERDWKIREKPGREFFYEKAFSFWKNSCLPAKM